MYFLVYTEACNPTEQRLIWFKLSVYSVKQIVAYMSRIDEIKSNQLQISLLCKYLYSMVFQARLWIFLKFCFDCYALKHYAHPGASCTPFKRFKHFDIPSLIMKWIESKSFIWNRISGEILKNKPLDETWDSPNIQRHAFYPPPCNVIIIQF